MPLNSSSYFFELSKRGHFQYPQDFSSEMFNTYYEHFNTDSLIVVHRHPNLLYYTYMKRLSVESESSCFGMSIVVNGLETDSIKSLFRLFERVFQQIVSDGQVLLISNEGEIVRTKAPFSSLASYFEELSATISRLVAEGSNLFAPMRPVNYSSSDDDFCCFPISENESSIRYRLSKYNKLFIEKQAIAISSGQNGLAVRIANLTAQLKYQKARNEELEGKVKGGVSSDRKWKSIAIASICVSVLLIGVLFYFVTCGLVSINL